MGNNLPTEETSDYDPETWVDRFGDFFILP